MSARETSKAMGVLRTVYFCPHCRVVVKPEANHFPLGIDYNGDWTAAVYTCPSCDQLSIHLEASKYVSVGPRSTIGFRAWPKGSNRKPLPTEASKYQGEYYEAASVLSDSARASAALTRRLLQRVLRDEAEATAHNLVRQIEEVLERNELPSDTAQLIDVIRNIGNFAAHPDEMILDVTPQEAELCLDILDRVIDFYVVSPAKTRAITESVNAKLRAAGKPELKQPPNSSPE
jgi:Domain of unknown function (DUF4145)